MPCYCDEPEKDNQTAIEKRCKVRMYFDAMELLTDEQIKIAEQKNICAFPLPDANTALCKLCSILDQDQMKKISAHYNQIKWKHKNLHDWYEQHMKDDENFSVKTDQGKQNEM